MWEVQGTPDTVERFGKFASPDFTIKPRDELVYYDSPKLFLFRGKDHQQFLAYECDAEAGKTRYLIVPCAPMTREALKLGVCSIRHVLNHNQLWAVDIGSGGKIEATWKLNSLKDIPDRCLPSEGAKLNGPVRRITNSMSQFISRG